MGSIEKLQNSSSEDDEFFDAHDDGGGIRFRADGQQQQPRGEDDGRMFRTSSIELLVNLDESLDSDLGSSGHFTASHHLGDGGGGGGSDFLTTPLDRRLHHYQLQCHSVDESLPCTPLPSPRLASAKPTHGEGAGSSSDGVLFILLHGGSILDTGQDPVASKNADVSTLVSTFNQIATAHYPSATGRLFVRLVPCPPVCSDALTLLISLYSGGFESVSASVDGAVAMRENFPLSALALFATSSPHYQDVLTVAARRANAVYDDFLRSDDGRGFSGIVSLSQRI